MVSLFNGKINAGCVGVDAMMNWVEVVLAK